MKFQTEEFKLLGEFKATMINLLKEMEKVNCRLEKIEEKEDKRFESTSQKILNLSKNQTSLGNRIENIEHILNGIIKKSEERRKFWQTKIFQIPAFLISLIALLVLVAEIFYRIPPK